MMQTYDFSVFWIPRRTYILNRHHPLCPLSGGHDGNCTLSGQMNSLIGCHKQFIDLMSKPWALKGLWDSSTVYPKKYAHGFCFAVLCCGYTLTDFPISIRLTSLALWQSNDCPSASKATLMNMDNYFMWIHYERLHNHNKAKHKKTVCIFLGIYCKWSFMVTAHRLPACSLLTQIKDMSHPVFDWVSKFFILQTPSYQAHPESNEFVILIDVIYPKICPVQNHR